MPAESGGGIWRSCGFADLAREARDEYRAAIRRYVREERAKLRKEGPRA